MSAKVARPSDEISSERFIGTDSKKILVPLLSGGLDSAVATLKARKELGIERLEPVFVDRGQTALRAEEAAFGHVCDLLGVPPKDRFRYNIGFEWYKRQKEKDPGQAHPYGRNLVLVAVAAAHAATLHHGSKNILLVGFTQDDIGDTSPEFVTSLNCVLRYAIEHNESGAIVEVRAPLIQMSKPEVIQWAWANDGSEIAEATWSCWKRDEPPHCGSCPACNKRQHAFEEARISDPTRYQQTHRV